MLCKHKNGTLTEVMDAVHEREFVNGKLEDIGINSIGSIQYYIFSCHDCEKKIKFQVTTKKKWLREIYKQLSELALL